MEEKAPTACFLGTDEPEVTGDITEDLSGNQETRRRMPVRLGLTRAGGK
jgi:hypothetical protein